MGEFRVNLKELEIDDCLQLLNINLLATQKTRTLIHNIHVNGANYPVELITRLQRQVNISKRVSGQLIQLITEPQ